MAVAPHVRRGHGHGVWGAGLDEYDGLARLGAAEDRGSARNVPEPMLFFVSCPSYGCNEVRAAYAFRIFGMKLERKGESARTLRAFSL